jgi:hypothetical protein
VQVDLDRVAVIAGRLLEVNAVAEICRALLRDPARASRVRQRGASLNSAKIEPA